MLDVYFCRSVYRITTYHRYYFSVVYVNFLIILQWMKGITFKVQLWKWISTIIMDSTKTLISISISTASLSNIDHQRLLYCELVMKDLWKLAMLLSKITIYWDWSKFYPTFMYRSKIFEISVFHVVLIYQNIKRLNVGIIIFLVNLHNIALGRNIFRR